MLKIMAFPIFRAKLMLAFLIHVNIDTWPKQLELFLLSSMVILLVEMKKIKNA
jgi:hypothetical protein